MGSIQQVLDSLSLSELKQKDELVSCLNCKNKCPGLISHSWRNSCEQCYCSIENHAVEYPSIISVLNELIPKTHEQYAEYKIACNQAKQLNYNWVPVGLTNSEIIEFMGSATEQTNHNGSNASDLRSLRLQVPYSDISFNSLKAIDKQYEEDVNHATNFFKLRSQNSLGLGIVCKLTNVDRICFTCNDVIPKGNYCIRLHRESWKYCWHPLCFRCCECQEIPAAYIYCWHMEKLYCQRHYAEVLYPRCKTCNELIFSSTYTLAMNTEHHSGHFSCKNCEKSLVGNRYILKEEQPYCLLCYEQIFAHVCEGCKEKIGCDSKDLSFKERHWHEKCFYCCDCATTLVDLPFATRDDLLFCSNCYDNKFAPRCDGCQDVFRAGMRKYEYRGKQWHEECFTCCECKQPIGARSFIPRDQVVICVPCYEDKYAQRCKKCTQVIRRGGVTYKGDPWHKECFTCTNCEKALAGIKFTSKDDQPYCAECYGELFAKKCCKCSKPITGFGGCKFISFENKHWHSECFSCNKCDCNLVGRGFLTNEDRIVCPDCGRS